MYPLNVQLAAPAVGFAVANDEAEHARLTEAGYLPALVKEAAPTAERDDLIAQANAKGVKIDKRWSDARIAEALAA